MAENPVDRRMAKIKEIASYQFASPIPGKIIPIKLKIILRPKAASRIKIHWSLNDSIKMERSELASLLESLLSP